MKRLLNTLYISNPDYYLSLDGENIVVKLKEEEIGRVPLHNIDGVVTMGFTGASPKLRGYCADKNIALTFISGNGRFLATVCVFWMLPNCVDYGLFLRRLLVKTKIAYAIIC